MHERSGPEKEPPARTEQHPREAGSRPDTGALPSRAPAGAPLLGPDLLALQQLAGNQAVSALVQRRRGGTTLDPHVQEATTPDVTGRYESTGGRRVTLQLNQAGHHLLGWWQLHTGAIDLGRVTFAGTYVPEDSGYRRVAFRYERQARGTQGLVGTLMAVQRRDAVIVQIHDPQHGVLDFERLSTAPRLSEEAIVGMPRETRELVRASETAPLDRVDEERLRATADAIVEALRAYVGTGAGQAGAAGRSAALRVDQLVGERMEQFGSSQRPLTVARLRQHLSTVGLRLGSETHARTAWDCLQVMVFVHQDEEVTGHVQGLGLARTGAAGPDQHRYRYQFGVVGLAGDVGVGLGAFLGSYHIEKLGPDRWGPVEYFTLMGQVSGGASAGWQTGQFGPWSEFQSPFPWTSANFRGPYMITSAQAGVALPITGRSSGAGSIIFEGNGSYPSLMADAGGVQTVTGLSVGADVSLATGYLWGGRDEAIARARRQQDVRAASSHRGAIDVHFAVNDPSLNAEGRRAVREMCATHRAAFESEASVLHIDGYASVTGPSGRNQQLSELRALNVLSAIRDILGPAYRIPPPRGGDRAMAEGHGEEPAAQAAREARAAGRPAPEEDPAWRRVDVALNGQVVLTLHGG